VIPEPVDISPFSSLEYSLKDFSCSLLVCHTLQVGEDYQVGAEAEQQINVSVEGAGIRRC